MRTDRIQSSIDSMLKFVSDGIYNHFVVKCNCADFEHEIGNEIRQEVIDGVISELFSNGWNAHVERKHEHNKTNVTVRIIVTSPVIEKEQEFIDD